MSINIWSLPAIKVSAIMLITSLLLIWVAAAHAYDGDIILGVWHDEEKDARIEIFRCGDKYCGKVVWINKPLYSADEDGGRAGKPRMDQNNPDPSLRSRPILGLQIMSGFVYAGDNRWSGGRLYDPKSGKTYSGKMTLVSKDRLDLRGYVLFSIFGRTSAWTRAGH